MRSFRAWPRAFPLPGPKDRVFLLEDKSADIFGQSLIENSAKKFLTPPPASTIPVQRLLSFDGHAQPPYQIVDVVSYPKLFSTDF